MEIGNSTKYNDKPLDEALLELKKDMDNDEWNLPFDPNKTAYRTIWGTPIIRRFVVYDVINEYMSGKDRLSGLELWEELHREMSAWIVIKSVEMTERRFDELLTNEREIMDTKNREVRKEANTLKKWNTVLLVMDVLLMISLLARCLIG